MPLFWRTPEGRLRIGVLVLLGFLCFGPVYAAVTQRWDPLELLLPALLIVGMTAITTAQQWAPKANSTRDVLRSPLYVAGVVALVALCGLVAYQFMTGFVEGFRGALRSR